MKKIILSLVILTFLGCEKQSEQAAFAGGTGKGGSLARFTILGNYLYTVDREKLSVFDISNGAQPVFKRTIPVGFEIETIFPFKDKLFIGSTTMVHIFSVADPAHPEKLAEAISPEVMRRCDPVVAKDNVAYATLRTSGPCGGAQSILAVYDISNISEPVQMNTVNVPSPYGLGYSGNTLYICDAVSGLMIYDITEPFEPEYVDALMMPGSSRIIDLIPYNNILVAWLSDGMAVYDINDKHNPVLIKKII
jgi:hypothetical protein